MQLVSIVIPTYNRVRDLERALKSVLAQTYSHWEVLIIDNYSNDNTDNLINGFNDSRLKLFKIHNEGVIAASRNLGILKAKGDYVALLDSDDWWVPQKLEESLKYLKQGADLVYHDLFVVTKSDQKFFWKLARTRNLKSPVFDDLLINGNAINNSSVVVRRDVLNKINGFSEDRIMIATEDYDGWLQIAKITENFTRIPQTLGYYWAGGGNISSPHQTLKILSALEERYSTDIINFGGRISWISYLRGRANFHLKFYEIAKKNFRLIRWRGSPFRTYVKSCWMRLLIELYRL